MRETVGVHIHHIAEGPGRCVSVRTLTRTQRVFHRLGTPLRYATRPVIPMVRSSRWSCLIRLQARWPGIDIFAWVFQAIGREIARPRHILYAYANRPRLPPSLSIRLSVCLPRVQPFLPRLVFLRCNTTCTNKSALFVPIPLRLSPFRLVQFLSVLGAMKTEIFLVIMSCNDAWRVFSKNYEHSS